MSRRRFLAATVVSLAAALSTDAEAGPGRSASVERLAAGTRFETPVFKIVSGAVGPTIVILAGIHGDEPAPPIAANALADALRLELEEGTVVLVPEVNRPALSAATRHTPGGAPVDLNRSFPTPALPEPRGEMAPLLWELIRETDPDYVLDLHEGWDFHRRFPKSVGSSVTLVPGVDEERTRTLARAVVTAIDHTVDRPYKRFSLLAPGPLGSVARSVAESLGVPTLVFETTRLTQSLELRAAQQQLMVRAFLRELGAIR